jgi:hypothetical protein
MPSHNHAASPLIFPTSSTLLINPERTGSSRMGTGLTSCRPKNDQRRRPWPLRWQPRPSKGRNRSSTPSANQTLPAPLNTARRRRLCRLHSPAASFCGPRPRAKPWAPPPSSSPSASRGCGRERRIFRPRRTAASRRCGNDTCCVRVRRPRRLRFRRIPCPLWLARRRGLRRGR